MLPKIFHWIRHVLDQSKAVESAIIAGLLWWAFILALPFDTFDTSIAYRAMSGIAREEVWSGIFFVVAIASLYGMIMEQYSIRVTSLVISTGLWTFIAAMMAMGSLATTGTGIYFIVACLNAFVVYKVGEQRNGA